MQLGLLGTRFRAWLKANGSSRNMQMLAITALLVLAFVALISTKKGNTSSTEMADLFAGRQLSDTEMEHVEAALGSSDLTDYRRVGRQLQVPTTKRAGYLSAIHDAKALPSSFHTPTQDAINNASLIETSGHRTQRLHHAHEQEARLAICALPPVMDASVHFDSKVSDSFRGETLETAAVSIKTAPEQPLNEKAFRTIQAMLLGYRAGLEAQNITITDLTSGYFVRGSFDQPNNAPLMDIRKADLERAWKQRLAAAIPFAEIARMSVEVVPNEAATEATAVACSVVVSHSNEFEDAAYKEQIREAIKAQLPQNPLPPNEAVRVVVVDSPQIAQSQFTISPGAIVAMACGVIAGILAMLLFSSSTEKIQPEVGLRIYDGQTVDDVDTLQNANEADLQELAKQDPDTVAKSLSAFIDRAG